MEKLCRKCDTTKYTSEFNKKRNGRQPFCRDCMKAYLKERYAATREYSIKVRNQRRADLKREFAEFKSTLRCETCPETHPGTLDFHHRDGSEKEISISEAVCRGWGLKRLKEEISKCAVLCSNCHRKLHWEEKLLERATGIEPATNSLEG